MVARPEVAALAAAQNDYSKIRPPFDQKMANRLLMHMYRKGPWSHRNNISWSVFDKDATGAPNGLVTGTVDHVTRCSVAYHAVGVGNHSGKLQRIERALARKREFARAEQPVWQRDCTQAEQVSCPERHE